MLYIQPVTFYGLTALTEFAFFDFYSLNLDTLAVEAFYGLKSLKKLKNIYFSSLHVLNKGRFHYLPALTELRINFHHSVQSADSSVFCGLSSLTNLQA